jgi:hypothetical protein
LRPTPLQALKHPWFQNDKEIIRELIYVNEVICNHSEKKDIEYRDETPKYENIDNILEYDNN